MKLSFRLAAAAGIVITGLAFGVPVAAAAPAGPRKALWSATFASPQPGGASAVAEAVSPGGKTLFVAGSVGNSEQEGPTGWETIAYDTATGKVRWRHAFRGTESRYPDSAPGSVTVSPDGSAVFVSGFVTNKKQAGSLAVVAYSAATGARLWVYEAAPADSAVYSAVSPDGTTLYVVTQSFSAIAINTATGNLLWTSSVTFIGNDHPSFDGAMSTDGTQLVISGFYNGGAGLVTADIGTATGATRWTRFYPGLGFDGAYPAVTVSPDGSSVFLSCQDIVIDYNSTNGLIRWSETANVGSSVAVGPDGSTVYTAGIGSGGSYDLSALSAASGTLQWSAALGGSEAQGPVLAVSPEGSALYVAGAGVMQAYNTLTGAPLWAAQSGDANAVAVSPTGAKVFVTGGTGLLFQSEFLTSAYRA